MNSTISDVLAFVKEHDVKFVRLGFCDPFGFQKNISIMAHELPAAFAQGVSIDAHAIRGFRDAARSDLLLFPVAGTLTVLPWRPGPGRVMRFYCDIKNPDGTPFARDGRHLLRRVVQRAEAMGYVCKVGAECEFYLFKTDEHGEPTYTTLDRGGYLDISPLDKGEDIRREICLTLEEMGIQPEASHHEQGPGQNEVDFKFSDAMGCADNLLTFKSVVKAIAARNGLFASFMPKPIAGAPGSGMHVNLSLTKNGRNLFEQGSVQGTAAASFMAGILAKTPEISLFLNPLVNSYERFGAFEAPRYVSWSPQNRSQLVRIPAASGEKLRMELRSPDPTANPYLAFALILAAGLDGIEQNMQPPEPVEADLFAADESVTSRLTRLPESLAVAIELAQKSDLVRQVLGAEFLDCHLAMQKAEAEAFAAAKDKQAFYRERYFPMI